MTTILLDAPEFRQLAEMLRHGEPVEFMDHGEVIARLPPRGRALADRLSAFRSGLGAPALVHDSVEALRGEDER